MLRRSYLVHHLVRTYVCHSMASYPVITASFSHSLFPLAKKISLRPSLTRFLNLNPFKSAVIAADNDFFLTTRIPTSLLSISLNPKTYPEFGKDTIWLLGLRRETKTKTKRELLCMRDYNTSSEISSETSSKTSSDSSNPGDSPGLDIITGKAAVLEFMKTEGVDIDMVQDLKLPEDVEIMRERFEFLRVLGLNAAELINEFPPLAGCSVSRNFIPVLDYLENIPIGRASLPKVIQKYPRVLYFSVKIDMEPIIDYLLGMGVMPKNLEKILVRYPQILGFRLEGTMSTSVAYLVSLGVDMKLIGDIITSEPEILGMRVGNNLLPKVTFLQSLGISKNLLGNMIQRHPFVLQFSVQPQMETTVAELIELGVKKEDIGGIVGRFPDILGLPVKEKAMKVKEWVSRRFGFGGDRLPKLIKRLPQILIVNKQKADLKIDYFINYGFSLKQVGEIVFRAPKILGANVSETIRPRLDYLVQKAGRGLEEIVEYPDCLFEKVEVLQSRLEGSEEVRRKSSLKWLLDCTDQKFKERIEINFSEGSKSSPELVEGPVVITTSLPRKGEGLTSTEGRREVRTNASSRGRRRPVW